MANMRQLNMQAEGRAEQMGVSYMKMEERDRLIREEGERKGETKSLISIIRKKTEKGYGAEKIAADLEMKKEKVILILEALEKYGDRTDREIAEMMVEENS